jgi:hypothetical protein
MPFRGRPTTLAVVPKSHRPTRTCEGQELDHSPEQGAAERHGRVGNPASNELTHGIVLPGIDEVARQTIDNSHDIFVSRQAVMLDHFETTAS